MRLIDTHSHLYAKDFNQDIDDVILRAKNSGVTKILLPNIDSKSISQLYRLVDKYPDICIPMMGIHPTSIKENYKALLDLVEQELDKRSFCAIGEIGIDLYWDKTFVKEQIEAFEKQLEWSIQYKLPVSIHARNAIQEVITSIKKIGADQLRGVFHSFVGDENELKELLEFDNFLLGINGVVTYKNSDLRTVLKKAPIDRIVIETDAPYLTPVPYRGKRNESSYTSYIAKELALIFNLTEEQIGNKTSENASRLFHL